MMSIRSLWRRKLRTSLTILGVVIGVCSIVLMLSLGIAMNITFRQQMDGMGSLTLINVRGNNYSDAKAPKLDDEALKSFNSIEGVQKAMPSMRTNVYLQYGKYKTVWDVEVQGMEAEDMDLLAYEVEKGRNLESEDKNVIVLGGDLTTEFVKNGKKFDWSNPPQIDFDVESGKIKIDLAQRDQRTGKLQTDTNGKPVKAPKEYSLKLIGITPIGVDYAYTAYIPMKLYEEMIKEKTRYETKLYGKENARNRDKNKYQSVVVKVKSEEEVVPVQDAIKELGFMAYSSMEWLEEMKKASNSIQIMLGAIGAVSLVVAAIGITNTMMMSIYERTKEIGVMKVIGAKLVDIKKMFLVEALMIGAIGGMIGIVTSYGLSYLINRFGMQIASNMMMATGEKISMIPFWLAGVALVFSTLIGLGAGYFPAKRAMKLSALSAIRTE